MTYQKKHKNKIKQGFGDNVFGKVNFILVTLLMIALVYPFLYCIILAFNDGFDAMLPGIYFFPRVFTLDNFKIALSQSGLPQAALISVLRTVIGTLFTVIFTSAFAYAISKPYLRFKKFYFILLIIPMYFGGGMVPTFILFDQLGLFNSFLVYVLPGAFSVFYALVFKAFFEDIPESLEESAKLDGAGHIRVFFQIVIPVSMPVIAAVCVFTAVGHWNSWQDTLLYMTDKSGELNTLAYNFAQSAQRVAEMERIAKTTMASNPQAILRGATGVSVQLAAMLVSVTPIMIIYPFFQKYFVRGVMIGAVKG